MIPNFARNLFYSLHAQQGFPRFLADSMSYAFMAGVRISGAKPRMDRSPLTLISHRYRFVYIGIPKVATRSFRTFFLQSGDEYQIESWESQKGFKNALKQYHNYFKFSFVRDPLRRSFSCYNSKIGHEDLSLLKRARIMSFYKGLYPGMSFDEFAQWLNSPEGQDHAADRHWLSQHKFLYHESGLPVCDFIGRYENLQDDLLQVLSKLEIPAIQLPKAGWISEKSNLNAISPEAISLIRARYALDYELFEYF